MSTLMHRPLTKDAAESGRIPHDPWRSIVLRLRAAVTPGAGWWTHLRSLPPTATPQGTAAQTAVQFAGGAVLALALAALSGQDRRLAVVMCCIAALAALLALMIAGRGRISRLGLHTCLLLGFGFVTAAVFTAESARSSDAFLFVYAVVVVVAIASSSWLGVGLHLGLAVTAIAVQHLMRGGGDLTPVVTTSYVMVMVMVFAAGILRAAVAAEVDVLTRLMNRRGFEKRLHAHLAEAHPSGAREPQLSVLLVDLDHFKVINDSGGAAAGDRVLREVADALCGAAPAGAVVARLEGDAFAVLLPGADADAAVTIAEQLRLAAGPVELSVGAALWEPQQDGGVLVRRAEGALHAAKAGGRGCTRLAEPHDEQLVRDLSEAITGGSIRVALQPIVTPADGALVGVEALARWSHPVRGVVSPARFIPAAERSGLMPALGQALLQQACAEVRHLTDGVGRRVFLTVNASGAELMRPDYVDGVCEVLQRTGWRARDLVIEVTESSVETASTATRATLERLRDMGVAVAIDDFGTGYSAFSQLDALPADYLKLDAAFTATTTTSARRRAMLRALVTLCADLGLQVIAEGVEDAEQAKLVADHGCALAQGYYFARPSEVAGLITTYAPGKTTLARTHHGGRAVGAGFSGSATVEQQC